MLLTIHNFPIRTQYKDIKELIISKCGLKEVILDNLLNEDNGVQVTVGVMEEGDAAILVRKINGLYYNGQQLYVKDKRQTQESEQPYRVSVKHQAQCMPQPQLELDDNYNAQLDMQQAVDYPIYPPVINYQSVHQTSQIAYLGYGGVQGQLQQPIYAVVGYQPPPYSGLQENEDAPRNGGQEYSPRHRHKKDKQRKRHDRSQSQDANELRSRPLKDDAHRESLRQGHSSYGHTLLDGRKPYGRDLDSDQKYRGRHETIERRSRGDVSISQRDSNEYGSRCDPSSYETGSRSRSSHGEHVKARDSRIFHGSDRDDRSNKTVSYKRGWEKNFGNDDESRRGQSDRRVENTQGPSRPWYHHDSETQPPPIKKYRDPVTPNATSFKKQKQRNLAPPNTESLKKQSDFSAQNDLPSEVNSSKLFRKNFNKSGGMIMMEIGINLDLVPILTAGPSPLKKALRKAVNMRIYSFVKRNEVLSWEEIVHRYRVIYPTSGDLAFFNEIKRTIAEQEQQQNLTTNPVESFEKEIPEVSTTTASYPCTSYKSDGKIDELSKEEIKLSGGIVAKFEQPPSAVRRVRKRCRRPIQHSNVNILDRDWQKQEEKEKNKALRLNNAKFSNDLIVDITDDGEDAKRKEKARATSAGGKHLANMKAGGVTDTSEFVNIENSADEEDSGDEADDYVGAGADFDLDDIDIDDLNENDLEDY